VLLSPPWGGPSYREHDVFDLDTLEPAPASELVRGALAVAGAALLYVPVRSDRAQLRAIALVQGVPLVLREYSVQVRAGVVCAARVLVTAQPPRSV
jgi:trimethylguanosine synthase